MIWNRVINQEHAISSLKASIASNRVAHAYLFVGPDGVGKKATALAFAQAMLCPNKDGAEPCGTCNSCRKSAKLIHPDLRIILPYAGDPKPEEISQRFEMLAEDPYGPVDFVHAPNGIGAEKQSTNKQILVKRERINEELIRPASFKAVEGGYKIAILTNFELLRPAVANAVLKLLEEPPEKTVFVLTTPRVDKLLPTIVSRCHRANFTRLSVQDISEGIRDRYEIDESQVGPIARMADGSMTKAIQIAGNQELLALRMMVVDFLRLSWVNDVEGIQQQIQTYSSGGREQVKNVLSTLLTWLRDLILFGSTGDLSFVVNTDQGETIRKFSANLPDADLPAMVHAVEDAIRLVQRNVNSALVLVSLSIELRKLMRGIGDGRLYEPLAG